MKKNMVVPFLMLFSIMILGGCSMGSALYIRPNTTDSQTNRDYDYCVRESEKDYPEKIVVEKGNTTTTECTTKKEKTICTSRVDDVQTDLNSSNRDRARVGCMEYKGYKRTTKYG